MKNLKSDMRNFLILLISIGLWSTIVEAFLETSSVLDHWFSKIIPGLTYESLPGDSLLRLARYNIANGISSGFALLAIGILLLIFFPFLPRAGHMIASILLMYSFMLFAAPIIEAAIVLFKCNPIGVEIPVCAWNSNSDYYQDTTRHWLYNLIMSISLVLFMVFLVRDQTMK